MVSGRACKRRLLVSLARSHEFARGRGCDFLTRRLPYFAPSFHPSNFPRTEAPVALSYLTRRMSSLPTSHVPSSRTYTLRVRWSYWVGLA